MVGTLGLGGAGDEGDDGGEGEEGGGALEDEEEEGLPFLFLFWSFFFSLILPKTLLTKSITVQNYALFLVIPRPWNCQGP